MPRHPDEGRVRRYCIYYNLSGIISQQLSQECKKNFKFPEDCGKKWEIGAKKWEFSQVPHRTKGIGTT